VLGFTLIRDLAPGEAVYITEDGKLHTRQCATNPSLHPCIFEHVYLARPDSIIDGVSVYKARLRMGEKLAEKILRERPSTTSTWSSRFRTPAAPPRWSWPTTWA
jgi:amidophosphoribosyltransferase